MKKLQDSNLGPRGLESAVLTTKAYLDITVPICQAYLDMFRLRVLKKFTSAKISLFNEPRSAFMSVKTTQLPPCKQS